MKLERQVCSLELAKRLKELGVKQESLFWHRVPKVPNPLDCMITDYPIENSHFSAVAAFTVAELGEMLPPTLGEPVDIELYVYEKPRRYGIEACDYKEGGAKKMHWSVIDDIEADARAKMLVYLLENNLITLN